MYIYVYEHYIGNQNKEIVWSIIQITKRLSAPLLMHQCACREAHQFNHRYIIVIICLWVLPKTDCFGLHTRIQLGIKVN